TQLPNLLRSGTVTYRIAVAHKNDTDGSFTIQENGSPLVTVQVAGKRDESYVEYVARQTMLSVPASTIAADNRSVLRMSYVNPSNPTSAFGYIDFFEIHYPSQLVPHNNSVDFVSDTGVTGVVRYDFNGFSGNPIGFDVTDPANPILLTNQATTGGMFNFTAKIDSASPRSFYISASITSPDIERVGEWANLRDDIANAHVIVVTAPELLASAMNYAKYREANSSMKVKVVSTTALYHEFSSGVPDITAIRDYIAYAYRNWTSVKPAYVILWGDGHFDYKSISAINRNFIPTYQTDDIDPSFNRDYYWRYTDNYSTEDYFVCVNGNDRLVDVTLGRVPINSPEEGDWALEKIRIYEKESSQDAWRTFVTMIADDGPTSYGTDYNSHTQQSENIANDDIEMPEDIQVRKIYMAEYPTENIPKGRRKPRVTEDMLTAVNARGSVILNWIGHGNPRVWAHEVIYDRDETTQQFTNLTKQFFLVAATCDFARFDLAEGQSGAEALVMSRRGGAIGCFSSTRVVFSGENAALAQDFYRELFRRGSNGLYKRIGDVIAVTKQTNTSVNDQKYFLLGDPTVRIHVPNSVVKFSSINGISVDSSTDINVKALSEVTIRGTIGDFPGTSVDKSYNGIVQLTMFDTDVNMRVQDPAAMASSARDSSVHAFSRLGAALHRGTYQVVNGEFTATFIVPKDISFLNKPGRLFGYSRTNDSTRYAKGMTDKFSVGGISDIGFSDDNGPVMNIFMDERTFKAGDLVRSNPLLIVDLADESGINATGIGVGHKIEAWLDDNTESIDLTEDFTTSLKDAKSGSAIKQLFALSPGQHTVRVRAWDILNNFTQGSTYFRVGENDKSVFSGRVEVYPNPFSEKINVFFTHNQGFSFDAELRIFTVQGKQVRYIQQSTTTLQSGNFLWDGTDEDGATLPQGTYPFTLRLIAADGNAQVYRGIMIYLQ
ncbi:MAG: type IX secretion system sortase PorU, partial [Candidatus Kapabacteria bacterium]|nr:type IX secretion system sortase PorU [Candidatus Kapabacteria bacterium]